MLVRQLKDCAEFISGDGVILRELLNTNKGNFSFRYSLAHAILKAGKRSQLHSLKNSEVYYIISGKGCMHVDQEFSEVGPGCVVYIPPEAKQYIENIGQDDLVFVCIVDPAWRKQDELIIT